MLFWYWAAIGAVLGVIEVAIPATVCIWLGVAAIAWRYPGLAWERQALIFSAIAVTSIVFGRTACARVGSTARDRHLNRRDESYVGRVRERPRQRVGAVDAGATASSSPFVLRQVPGSDPSTAINQIHLSEAQLLGPDVGLEPRADLGIQPAD